MLQALKNSGHLFLKCLLLSNSLKREKEGALVFSTLTKGWNIKQWRMNSKQ